MVWQRAAHMNRARKLLVPSILTGALLAALVIAPTASAEIRVGEGTAAVNPSINPEADVIAAKAEYNSDTGFQTFAVTTAAAPRQEDANGEPSALTMLAGLATTGTCSRTAIYASTFPTFSFEYQYAADVPAVWRIQETADQEPEFPDTLGPAVKSTVGSTTTFSATAPKAVGGPYNCAAAYVYDPDAGGQPELLLFPIAVPPPPPAPVIPAPAPTPAPAPVQPAPAALSIAKLKPLQLKVGKWKTVRIKVANPGGLATARGSLRLKAPKGVLVKPEKQKLPVLTAGDTWALSAKVQLTAKAKKKSTVALTATAGSATAKGSLVLKRRG